MIIDLDVGNTAVKWRMVDEGSVIEEGVSVAGVESALLEEIDKQGLSLGLSKKLRIRISCVQSNANSELASQVALKRWGVCAEFAKTASQTGRIVNSYKDPSKMGVDRWLAILAASAEVKLSEEGGAVLQHHICVIDAGTALTLDFVDIQGFHQGGYIVPGIGLQLKALSQNTAQVQVDKPIDANLLRPGKSTEDAVRRGVLLQAVAFVEEAITRYRDECAGESVLVFLTGGDSCALLELSGMSVELRKNLVLDGLPILLP